MVPYYGDFAEDDTVNIPFNTFSSDDPSASATITDLADADIKVHKDAHIDQIVTDGATVVINFDGITGNHMINIDTSVDAAYATGSEYQVRVEGTTVDGATINAWIGSFSIERAGGTVALLKLIQAAVITNAAGADVAADIIAVKAETALIVADTGELQVDDIPGTLSTMDGKLDTAQTDLDTITGTAGVLIGTDAMDRSGTLSINTKTFTAGSLANATFNADVGSTAHSTNIIALAVRKILEELNLDHLLKVTTGVAADGDLEAFAVAGTVIAHLLATGADATTYKASTDSLQSIRDVAPHGSTMVGTDNANTVVPDAAGTAATPAEVATALTDIKLDHLINTAAAEDEVADNSVIARLAATEGDWSEFNDENHSLEAIRVRGDAAWPTATSVTVSDKTGFSLSSAGIDAVFDRNSSLSISFEVLIERIYQLTQDKLIYVNATGGASLRDIGDSNDIATWTVDDDDTNTTRTEATWA